ncbi:MAG: Lrp/AsnC family transcriptional regulator [Gammaproteobacteria bacterium]|jgi:Lrp/AsnC family transcriptional regulator
MTESQLETGTPAPLDEADRAILRLLQQNATVSMERIASKVGVSKTSVWNRLQRMTRDGVIMRQTIIVNPARVGLNETFFIEVRTDQHNAQWLEEFAALVQSTPEIMEAHRLAGRIDYLLKVQVASTREFDSFYQRLVARIHLFDVSSSLSMEVLKHETALPL